VDSTNYSWSSANSFYKPTTVFVNKSFNIASLSDSKTHNCALGTRIYKSLNWHIIYLAINVKHVCMREKLWIKLFCMRSIFRNISSVNVFFCLFISLNIKRIFFKSLHYVQVLLFGFLFLHNLFLHNLRKFCKITLKSFSYGYSLIWISGRNLINLLWVCLKLSQ